MSYLWIIFEFFVCVIEMVLFFVYFSKFLVKKSWCKRYHLVAAIFLGSLIILIATYFEIFSFWKLILGFFIAILYSIIFYNEKLWLKLVYAAIIYGIFALSEVFTINMMKILLGESFSEVAITLNINRICFFAISKILILLIYGIASYTKFAKTVERYNIPIRYWFSFLFTFSAIFVTVFLLLDASFYTNDDAHMVKVSIIMSIVLFLVFVFTYYLFIQMCNYFLEKNAENMIEYQTETMEKYIIQQEISIDTMRDMNHNMKYYLVELRELLLDGCITEAVESISKYHKEIKSAELLTLGSPIGDAMINQKRTEASQYDVKFIINGSFDEGLLIEKKDLCSLLGNILDNALEATMEIEEANKRYISVSIKRDSQFLYLSVKNSYKNEPVQVEGSLLTSKENRTGHGIGILSIEKIANKYGGISTFKFERNVFEMFVMLIAYDNKGQKNTIIA